MCNIPRKPLSSCYVTEEDKMPDDDAVDRLLLMAILFMCNMGLRKFVVKYIDRR
jgi:hypothetical protein